MLLARVEQRIKAGAVARRRHAGDAQTPAGVYYQQHRAAARLLPGAGQAQTVDGMAPIDAVTAAIAGLVNSAG